MLHIEFGFFEYSVQSKTKTTLFTKGASLVFFTLMKRLIHLIHFCVCQYRGEKIEKLCGVMGVEWPYDPDDSYELTTDNLKKILAIHMRFR